MNDGRDYLGRPVFGNGLGVGDPRRYGTEVRRGAEIVPYTPGQELSQQRQPPPMTGLSRRAAPTIASEDAPLRRGAEVIGPGAGEAPPTPPPMAGMRRSGLPGSESYSSAHDPALARAVGAQIIPAGDAVRETPPPMTGLSRRADVYDTRAACSLWRSLGAAAHRAARLPPPRAGLEP
jgi:hypothetical protein